MNPLSSLKHEFVESFPDDLKNGTIYVSVVYATAAHKCCCGCGERVITPISPKGWTLTFNGEAVSLHPSIGNWNFVCQSHYWIKGNGIMWVDDSTQEGLSAAKSDAASAKAGRSGGTSASTTRDPVRDADKPVKAKRKESFWQKAKKWKWW